MTVKVHKTRMNAGKVLKALKAKFEGVQFSTNEVEGGVSITANLTSEIATTELLAALDGEGVGVEIHAELPPEPVKEVKEPKEPKPPREKKPTLRWSERWKFAPALVDKKVAEGQPAFKPGSKRDITRQLLLQENGCTMDEACASLGWDKATVYSSFTEIAYLLHSRVHLTKVNGQPNRYSMIPWTPEQEAAAKEVRANRKIEVEAKKEAKAKAKAEKAAAAAAAAEAQKNAAATEQVAAE